MHETKERLKSSIGATHEVELPPALLHAERRHLREQHVEGPIGARRNGRAERAHARREHLSRKHPANGPEADGEDGVPAERISGGGETYRLCGSRQEDHGDGAELAGVGGAARVRGRIGRDEGGEDGKRYGHAARAEDERLLASNRVKDKDLWSGEPPCPEVAVKHDAHDKYQVDDGADSACNQKQ